MPVFGYGQGRQGGCLGRFAIVGVIAVVAVVGYLMKYERNPTTGQYQAVALNPSQEIALGLRSAPEMASQMGGTLRDARAAKVSEVGQRLVAGGKAAGSPYGKNFQFHLLNDDATVNAFALPGGQIFITTALYDRLANEAQLAGVLGHEIGHVLYRHSSEQMAKSQLGQQLVGAVAVGSGDTSATYAAQFASQMINLRYGRGDELESDEWGLISMREAGYDPSQMLAVMETLKAAGGKGGRGPAIFATHPDPDARLARIRAYLDHHFPNGVPAGVNTGGPLPR